MSKLRIARKEGNKCLISESKTGRNEPVDTEGFNAERIEPLQNGIKLRVAWGRFTISFVNEL